LKTTQWTASSRTKTISAFLLQGVNEMSRSVLVGGVGVNELRLTTSVVEKQAPASRPIFGTMMNVAREVSQVRQIPSQTPLNACYTRLM
jgi:hypothetical protein